MTTRSVGVTLLENHQTHDLLSDPNEQPKSVNTRTRARRSAKKTFDDDADP